MAMPGNVLRSDFRNFCFTSSEWENLSEEGALEAHSLWLEYKKSNPLIERPYRETLIKWAFDLGVETNYRLEFPDDCYPHLKRTLHDVRDLIPRQKDAYDYLCKQVHQGWNSVLGWHFWHIWTLKPLFERGASKQEIVAAAEFGQGDIPNWAISNLLRIIPQEIAAKRDFDASPSKFRK